MLVLLVDTVTVDPLVLAGLDEVDAAGADVLGGLLAGGDELPHAVSTAAAPASTGTAHQLLRMIISPFLEACGLPIR
jgi:hypothetical protein